MSQFDKAVQFDEDAPRCPRCAKRLTADDSFCPSCGFELLPHHARIRCGRCGRRIPADSQKCPRCGGDPHAARFSNAARTLRLTMVVAGVLLLVCLGWVIFRALTTNSLPPVLGLNEPTRAPTQFVQVIQVVATPIPPTSTPIPLPTAIPISRVSPTPTRRGTQPVTAAPPTSTPIPAFYPVPQLTAPANTTVYSGADAIINLQWQPVSTAGLRENEWYLILVTFTARDGSAAERKSFSKEPRWIVPSAWWNDVSPNARSFKWNITVVRIEGIDPFASPTRTPASPTSATRAFFWN